MTTTTTPNTYEPETDVRAGSVFGGTVLIIVGLLQFFEGLSAVLKDDVYVTTRDYVYQFDLTTWGWIHLLVGVAALGVGTAVLFGQRWALVAGIIMATLSAVLQFLFIPWQPLWALVLIGINIAVMYALATRFDEG